MDGVMSKRESKQETVQKENEELRQQLEDAEFENGQLRQKVVLYKQETENGHNNMDNEQERLRLIGETMQKHVGNLEKEKNLLYKQVESLEVENENLKKTVYETNTEINMLQDENQRVKGLIKRYEENLDDAGDLNGVVSEQEQVIKKMNKDYTNMKNKLEEEIANIKQENIGG